MRRLSAPSRCVTINLFASDVVLMERRYGRGWTEQVRRLVAENCREYRRRKDELETIMRETADELEN